MFSSLQCSVYVPSLTVRVAVQSTAGAKVGLLRPLFGRAPAWLQISPVDGFACLFSARYQSEATPKMRSGDCRYSALWSYLSVRDSMWNDISLGTCTASGASSRTTARCMLVRGNGPALRPCHFPTRLSHAKGVRCGLRRCHALPVHCTICALYPNEMSPRIKRSLLDTALMSTVARHLQEHYSTGRSFLKHVSFAKLFLQVSS